MPPRRRPALLCSRSLSYHGRLALLRECATRVARYRSKPSATARLALVALVTMFVVASVVTGSASVSLRGDWETGDNSQFTGLECVHPSTQFAVVTSPVREGKYAAMFHQETGDTWSNGSTRCLDTIYNSGETSGQEHWYGLSTYVATSIDTSLLWEIHQSSKLYNTPGCGVAPFAIVVRQGAYQFRISTGDCASGSPTHFEHITLGDLNPYPKGVWVDFVVHIRYTEANDGVVEVWERVQGKPWPSQPQVSRAGIPTMVFNTATNVHNDVYYTEMGIYSNYSPFSGNETVYLDGYRRGTSFADVAPGGSDATSATAPPPTTSTTTPTTTTATTTATTTTATGATTSATTTTSSSGSGSTTTTTPTTTTTTTTPTSGDTSKSNNGKKPPSPPGKKTDAPADSTRSLAAARVVRTPALGRAGRYVHVVATTVQVPRKASLRVSLVSADLRKHPRLPLLAHSTVGPALTGFWKKTIVTGYVPAGETKVALRIPSRLLKHGQRYSIRVRAVGANESSTMYVRFVG